MVACTQCGEAFTVTDDEKKFIKNMGFVFGKQTVDFPLPTRCPACRLRRRTAHRNERFLYKRTSDMSGKSIVSLYHSEPVGPVYKVWSQEEWKSDAFDPMKTGREFDFTRPFFPQFAELQRDTPHMALISLDNENSEFTTGTGYCKNCYLINSSEYCQDCMYGKLLQTCSDALDCHYLYDSQICYECFSVYNSYNCSYLRFSKNCSDCHFGSSLYNCKNCFLCVNLDRKEYHFLNESLPKADYEKKVAEFKNSYSKREEALKKLAELEKNSIHKAANIVNADGCTGDYIENSSKCYDCFDCSDCQDCTNVTVGVGAKDVRDSSNMYVKPELAWETLGTISTYHTAYCLYIFNCSDILYSELCFSCKNLFGCSGLTRKEYCIFNTQYSKEEYEALVPKILEHMRDTKEFGEFFPQQFSPFGYNESVASEYMPMTKEEALKQGFHWRDTKDELLTVSKTIPASQLPDSISEIPDDVLDWAMECDVSKRPFKLQKQELAFYRKNGLPLPRKHPDVRYEERMKLRNPRMLWNRTCDHCGKTVQSTYAPDRKEKIYCESCYKKTVF